MTTQEAAEALGIDRSRVLRFIRDGRLQAERHGRDWWITPQEVERFKALERPMGWKKGRKRKDAG
jgi:excisionase family DNA binding protein